MIASFIASLGQAVTAVFDWTTSLFDASGALSVIVTFIIIVLVYRFLLSPILGSSGSDSAKPKEDKK